MTAANSPVGMIGLGLLGSALAERFLMAGQPVLGYDLAKDRCAELAARGGRVAHSSVDVFASCSRVLLSLTDSNAVSSVMTAVAEVLRPGQLIIDTTTGEPGATAELGRNLAERHVHYVDATIAGSSADVRRGEVVVMAGGAPDAFAAGADLFACFASRSFLVGPMGSGSRMKLAVNLVLGLNRAALAEALAFASHLGLEPSTTLAVLQAGAAYSRAMDAKGDKMIHGDFTPQARLAQHLKDVHLMLEAGARAGAKLPLTTVHAALLEALTAAGHGALDNSAIIKAFQ